MLDSIIQFYDESKIWLSNEVAKHNQWRSITWNATFDEHEEINIISQFKSDLSKSGLFSGFQSMKFSYETSHKFFHQFFYTTVPNAAADLKAGAEEVFQSLMNFLSLAASKTATALGTVFGPIVGSMHGFSVTTVGLIWDNIAKAAHAYDNQYELTDDPYFEMTKTIAAYAMTAYMLYKSLQFIRGLFNGGPAKLLADREKAVKIQEADLASKKTAAEKTIEEAGKASEKITLAASRIAIADEREKAAHDREQAAEQKLKEVKAANDMIDKALKKQQKFYLTRAACTKGPITSSNVSSSNNIRDEDSLSSSSSSSSHEADAANDDEKVDGASPNSKQPNTRSSKKKVNHN